MRTRGGGLLLATLLTALAGAARGQAELVYEIAVAADAPLLEVSVVVMPDANGLVTLEYGASTLLGSGPRLPLAPSTIIGLRAEPLAPADLPVKVSSNGAGSWVAGGQRDHAVRLVWSAAPSRRLTAPTERSTLRRGSYVVELDHVLLRVAHLADAPHRVRFRDPVPLALTGERDRRARDWSALTRTPLVVGGEEAFEIRHRDRTLRVVLLGFDALDGRPAGEKARTALRRACERLWPAQVGLAPEDTPDVELVISVADRRTGAAVRGGRTFLAESPAVLGGRNPEVSLAFSLARALATGARLERWNDRLAPDARADSAWFRAGVARHLADLALLRAGYFPESTFLRRVARRSVSARGRARGASYSPREASRRLELLGRTPDDEPSPEEIGALLAVCLDARLALLGEGSLAAREDLWNALALGGPAPGLSPPHRRDLALFRALHVDGTREPPLGRAAAALGLRHAADFRRSDLPSPGDRATTARRSSPATRVSTSAPATSCSRSTARRTTGSRSGCGGRRRRGRAPCSPSRAARTASREPRLSGRSGSGSSRLSPMRARARRRGSAAAGCSSAQRKGTESQAP
ncbi:MAG: hypothetical protein R3F20_11170 [Planctomycetota bacterium]